ncbi:hypothetical protein HU200_060999 [Digitaria exilis]|uniref:Uncharacterized protein n=1 Tax=Digitaria exilis TaxID=1010633 RepID=A0A835ADF3_9POAL|nr:hypothetical protein HU200_060999 [Digitaria exilis]
MEQIAASCCLAAGSLFHGPNKDFAGHHGSHQIDQTSSPPYVASALASCTRSMRPLIDPRRRGRSAVASELDAMRPLWGGQNGGFHPSTHRSETRSHHQPRPCGLCFEPTARAHHLFDGDATRAVFPTKAIGGEIHGHSRIARLLDPSRGHGAVVVHAGRLVFFDDRLVAMPGDDHLRRHQVPPPDMFRRRGSPVVLIDMANKQDLPLRRAARRLRGGVGPRAGGLLLPSRPTNTDDDNSGDRLQSGGAFALPESA